MLIRKLQRRRGDSIMQLVLICILVLLITCTSWRCIVVARSFLLGAFVSLFAMAGQAQRLPGNAIVEGVPPRELTDPTSVVSQPLAGAAPVPLADLFFTRRGTDAIWIPHSGDVTPKVDAIFKEYAGQPGCNVGVARSGKLILERSYGLA